MQMQDLGDVSKTISRNNKSSRLQTDSSARGVMTSST